MTGAPRRQWVCAVSDILDGAGVCALLDQQQVALFRVGEEVFALENIDPFSNANVIARGIVGDLKGQLVVASPVYKQHFSLRTGRCLEDEAVSLRVWSCGVLDGRVWIELPAVEAAPAQTRRRRLVVVGNGMAAMRTVEELLALAPDAYQITVFGAEPRGNYNRILLSPLLAGETAREELELHSPAWYQERGIHLHMGDPAVSIDRRRRRVLSAAGISAEYDRLLMATGSDPVRLKIPGNDLAGIFSFRSLDDVDAMTQRIGLAKSAVVVGGGLLGLEAASALCRHGLAVTVVHLRDRLMDRQLDTEAAQLLQNLLTARGVAFCLAARTQGFVGSTQVEGVRLEDGRTLPADLVVVAVGIVPRTDLARDCGLQCDRGILVNDTLQTFDPAVYAVGECVQHRGATYGLVAPLWEQARVCAEHLAERGVTRYRGTQPVSQLKVSGIELFSGGDINATAGAETLRYADPASGIYKRLWIRDNRLQAAVLFGDATDARWYADLIERQQDVTPWRGALLLGSNTPGAGA